MEFKFLGTKIYISFLFAALLCFMIALDRTKLMLPLLGATVIHEGAHLLCMWGIGCQPKAVRLIPASVQIVRNVTFKKYGEELIAAAGPLANILIFLIFLADYSFCHSENILRFAAVNLCVAVFNLLPVWGLDGGTLIACLISRFSRDPYKGQRVVRIITLFFGVFFFGVGVFLCIRGNVNLSFFAIALYLIIGTLIFK